MQARKLTDWGIPVHRGMGTSGAVGMFAVSAGPVMASNNEFKIVIRGKGGRWRAR